MTLQQRRTIHKALADINRLRILDRLAGGELCACHLLEDLDITQPTLSHHMKVLTAAGLVRGRKVGKWMHYCRAEDTFNQLKEAM